MPFIDGSGDKTQTDSSSKTSRQLDARLHSFDSDDNMVDAGTTGKAEHSSNSLLNLQSYSVSPLNKYIDTRSYGSPTQEENTDLSSSPRPKVCES